ncbi:hypothetical protein [Bdellovibrio bacteriovorus]|uniref:hypothetical protein n=1 Tax=Bdellovibrio bacteriovorus TaxID=959 RepID=UPI0035A90399
MKEQVIAAMLTLSLALGFIYSIEVLAQTNRTAEKSCHEDLQKYCQNTEAGDALKTDCDCRDKVKLLVRNR